MFVGEYLSRFRTNSLGQIRQQGVELFEVNSDNSNDFFQKNYQNLHFVFYISLTCVFL